MKFTVQHEFTATETICGMVMVTMSAKTTEDSLPTSMQVSAQGFIREDGPTPATGQAVSVSGTFNFETGLFSQITANSTPVAFIEELKKVVESAYQTLVSQIRELYPESVN